MTTKNNSLLITEMLKFEAKQFCLNTALHGYRFIVLPRRILLERVFWAIVVLISLVAALTLLCMAWMTFQENPTILVTDSTHYPIWNYPFPAVTICSFNKISKSAALQLAANMTRPMDMSVEELAYAFRILVQAIYADNDLIPYRNYTRLQDIIDTNDETIESVLRKLQPGCNKLLQRCKWKGSEKQCESIFETIKTSEGFCCAFNYYALRNHTFQGVLPHKIPKDARRVSACGYLTALEVLVNSNSSDYFATPIEASGHQVLLHNSYHYPDWTVQNLLTEQRILQMIGVTPTITYSTENIIPLDLRQRKCIFQNESYLHNFQVYNFHNCLTECRMNLTRTLCGCIPFFYYHDSGTYPKTKICTLRDLQCLKDNRHLLESSVPGYDFKSIRPNHEYGKETMPSCKCLPDCEYVTYVGEASSGIFTRKYSSNQLNLYGGVEIDQQSVVRVYFNDLVSTKNRRDVVFSWHTLLAYYGGLLGLFIGFSFVSAVEIVYYFVIRLLVDIQARSKDIKSKKNKREHKIHNVRPQQFESLNPAKILQEDRFRLRRRSNSNS